MKLKRPSRMRRGLTMMGSAFPSIWELTHSMVRSGEHKAWMAPLLVFLCFTGLLLIVAASVEALAPFIYTIF
jgi:hypothetical protein